MTVLALSLLCSSASATEVALTSPASGQFVSSGVIRGTVSPGVGTVFVNGEPVTVVPGILGQPGTFEIDAHDVPPGLEQPGQSALHSTRVEVIDTMTSAVLASDQVGWYDTSELGEEEPPARFRPAATSLRITESGLAEIATAVSGEMDARLHQLFDPGDHVLSDTSERPVAGCVNLGGGGFNLDALDLGELDFGLGDSLVDVPMSYFDLCAESYTLTVAADTTELLDPPVDPALVFDAVPNALDTTVNFGALTAAATLEVQTTLHVDVASVLGLGLPVTPTVGTVSFPVTCSVDAGFDRARGMVRLRVQPSASGGLRVRQAANMTSLLMGGFDAELGGICTALPLDTAVSAELEQRFEEVVVAVANAPLLDGKPALPGLLDPLLQPVAMSQVVPFGDLATVQYDAVFTDAVEDETGLTLIQAVRAQAVSVDPEIGLVRPQSMVYTPVEPAPLVDPGVDYDLEASVSTALLDQVLYEAYRSGVFHDQMTLTTDLSDLGFDTSGLASKALTADFLAEVFGPLDVVIPAGIDLVIETGPRFAPVVVTEDPPSANPNPELHVSLFEYHFDVVQKVAGGNDILWASAIGDFKGRLRLEVDANGALLPVYDEVQFELDYIDPDGTHFLLLGPSGLQTALSVKAQIRDRIREKLDAQFAAIPLDALIAPPGFASAPVFEFVPEDADTQWQRELMRFDLSAL